MRSLGFKVVRGEWDVGLWFVGMAGWRVVGVWLWVVSIGFWFLEFDGLLDGFGSTTSDRLV